WQFKAIDAYQNLPKQNTPITRWMWGTVPGTVHTDLLANKRIPDPYYRMNENDVQWVDAQQWVYKREFVVPDSMLDNEVIHVVAEGLDTYATITINGQRIADTANMFICHRFDVKPFLQTGKNEIEILFDSPTIRSKQTEQQHGVLRVALEPHRVYVRKAQYSFSWDWGPKLTTSGIWRNIFIEGRSHARLLNPFVNVISANEDEAVLEVSAEIETYSGNGYSVEIEVKNAETSLKTVATISGDRCTSRINIPSPKLWWPNGYGEQPLYTTQLRLLMDEKEIDTAETTLGIRTVRLVREKDAEGESFIIEVNGQKLFCKGADWIPSDNFIPRIQNSTYENLLTLARDAHMNMLRVWGGGIYEQDIFYELCDRLGLMVWQDFMYACGEYPDVQWFVDEARNEAEKVVKRLRNHPSIVIWCGNNEC
ncbi:MAG: sugar-binding domain-containing protein, partial [Bacteroidota bacterium]